MLGVQNVLPPSFEHVFGSAMETVVLKYFRSCFNTEVRPARSVYSLVRNRQRGGLKTSDLPHSLEKNNNKAIVWIISARKARIEVLTDENLQREPSRGCSGVVVQISTRAERHLC